MALRYFQPAVTSPTVILKNSVLSWRRAQAHYFVIEAHYRLRRWYLLGVFSLALLCAVSTKFIQPALPADVQRLAPSLRQRTSAQQLDRFAIEYEIHQRDTVWRLALLYDPAPTPMQKSLSVLRNNLWLLDHDTEKLQELERANSMAVLDRALRIPVGDQTQHKMTLGKLTFPIK